MLDGLQLLVAFDDGLAFMSEKYLLYIDILGFTELVKHNPEKVHQVYRIIDSLNVHRHNVFQTIVFSDTILVYNRITPTRLSDHEYIVMYSCEFAQDLLYRLIGQDLFFRAVLVAGEFNHYSLQHIECFFGKVLIDAYLKEKNIQGLGLFIHNHCTQYNKIFKTRFFDQEFDFVYLNQGLEDLQWGTGGELPIDPFLLRADEFWRILWDIRYLHDIHQTMTNHPAPRIRVKHLTTWEFYRQRYPKILAALEAGEFQPTVICNTYDWTDRMALFKKDLESFNRVGE